MSILDIDSPSVQTHLMILQGIITRMASNSASAKGWCVALVAAIVVVVWSQGSSVYVWIALLPIVLFCFLDAYYLGMERHFRNEYNEFVRKLQTGSVTTEDVFVIAPVRHVLRSARAAATSVSIWPFYGVLVALVIIVKCWVLK